MRFVGTFIYKDGVWRGHSMRRLNFGLKDVDTKTQVVLWVNVITEVTDDGTLGPVRVWNFNRSPLLSSGEIDVGMRGIIDRQNGEHLDEQAAINGAIGISEALAERKQRETYCWEPTKEALADLSQICRKAFAAKMEGKRVPGIMTIP